MWKMNLLCVARLSALLFGISNEGFIIYSSFGCGFDEHPVVRSNMLFLSYCCISAKSLESYEQVDASSAGFFGWKQHLTFLRSSYSADWRRLSGGQG